jgi:hypothetical protein
VTPQCSAIRFLSIFAPLGPSVFGDVAVEEPLELAAMLLGRLLEALVSGRVT